MLSSCEGITFFEVKTKVGNKRTKREAQEVLTTSRNSKKPHNKTNRMAEGSRTKLWELGDRFIWRSELGFGCNFGGREFEVELIKDGRIPIVRINGIYYGLDTRVVCMGRFISVESL